MTIPASIVPGASVFPRIQWRWQSETDILSGSFSSAGAVLSSETVELSGEDGAEIVLDVADGAICGIDIVIWPEVHAVAGLTPPAPEIAGRVTLPPEPDAAAVSARQVETELSIDVDPSETIFHIRLGDTRPVTVVQVADHLAIEVDLEEQLAGFWLTGVPPFVPED